MDQLHKQQFKLQAQAIYLGKPSKKKKTTKFRTLSEKGGGSTAAKLFSDEKYGHVNRGGLGVGAPRRN